MKVLCKTSFVKRKYFIDSSMIIGDKIALRDIEIESRFSTFVNIQHTIENKWYGVFNSFEIDTANSYLVRSESEDQLFVSVDKSYFYNAQELRKLKINKINKINI
jgi:hypothetical protein